MGKLLENITSRKQRNFSSFNPLALFMSGDKKKKSLVEGLIRTFPLEAAKKHFVDYMGINPDMFQILTTSNGVKIAVIYLDYDESLIKEYEKAMSFYGYYLGSTDDIQENGEHVVVLFFEPKFQDNVVGSNERYFMHVSPLKHKEKILKNGLCPRPSEKIINSYPDRIHLMGGIGKAYAFFLATELYRQERDLTHNDGKYVIFYLNADDILRQAKLERDPNFDRGYITMDNISPSAIEAFENIDVKDKIIGHRAD